MDPISLLDALTLYYIYAYCYSFIEEIGENHKQESIFIFCKQSFMTLCALILNKVICIVANSLQNLCFLRKGSPSFSHALSHPSIWLISFQNLYFVQNGSPSFSHALSHPSIWLIRHARSLVDPFVQSIDSVSW